MIFITHRIDDVAAGDWPGIQEAAAKNERSKVTVERFTDADEISVQQRKWLYCIAGPIRELVERNGWSYREAKNWLKREYGREWFVIEMTDENCEKAEGVFWWECRKATCRKIIHPMDVYLDVYDTIRYCPICKEDSLNPIAIKSIMDVSVKKTNLWFDEIFAEFPKNPDGSNRIQQPDPEWKNKLEKSKNKP